MIIKHEKINMSKTANHHQIKNLIDSRIDKIYNIKYS